MDDLVAFLSFTEITGAGDHRGYNAWHQLDHQPEQFRIPGVRFGQRWVSTPACRAARAASTSPLAPSHYMTLYLMGSPVVETLDAFWELAQELHGAGRFFPDRRSLLNGPFAVADRRAATRIHIAADVAPYRPNLGLYVVAERADTAGGADELRSNAPDELAALVTIDGVAAAWRVEGDVRLERHGWSVAGWTVTICFLDAPPIGLAAAIEPILRERWDRHGPPPALAGPFETITPWRWDWFDSESGGGER